MIFWLIVIGLILIAIAIVVFPMLAPQSQNETVDRQKQNILIAQQKKSTLDQQLTQGRISQPEYDSNLEDVQAVLAIDLERVEPEYQASAGKWAVWLLVLFIPLLSTGIYLTQGAYQVIADPSLADAATVPQNLTIDEMTQIVKQRLRNNPEDAQAWFAFGKILTAQRKLTESVVAFQRCYELVGDEPMVLFALASALALQNDGKLQGEPAQLLKRGLELSPQDPSGLWLAGSLAEQNQDYASARDYWTQLLPLIKDDAAASREVRGLIQILDDRNIDHDAVAPATKSLTLSVQLAPQIKHLAAQQDWVFVYAKAVDGPPMPLAVKRIQVQDLPAEINLSDEDAMMQNMKISAFKRVIVGARISKSGNAVAQAGDLFVEMSDIDLDDPAGALVLSISQVKE